MQVFVLVSIYYDFKAKKILCLFLYNIEMNE